MTWDIFAALITVFGALITFAGIVWKLSSTLSKLTAAVENLTIQQERMMNDVQDKSSLIHSRIDAVKKQTENIGNRIDDHETRITLLERN